MMLKADSTILESGDVCPVVFLQLKDIRMELSAFLGEAIEGTRLIVDECRNLTGPWADDNVRRGRLLRGTFLMNARS
jgi:hypothetical protein